jgi:hypothetical protein
MTPPPSAGPAELSWTCTITSTGGNDPNAFNYSVTATNNSQAEADVIAYTVVAFDANGNEVWSDPESYWSAAIVPGNSLTASELGYASATPATCQVTKWYHH